MERNNNSHFSTHSHISQVKQFSIETSNISKAKDKFGNKTINQYSILKELGKGSFGVVKLVQNNATNKLYAMKKYSKIFLKSKKEYYQDNNNRIQITTALDDVRREINIMKNLNHKNIIKLYEIIEEIDGDKIYLIMDYAKYGDLMIFDQKANQLVRSQNVQAPISEQQLINVLLDILEGVQYLHRNSIVHRDIKPSNLLIDENGKILIADFGSSIKFKENDILNNNVGTPQFFAPEMLQNNPKFSGKAADIWAIGITMYSFINNKFPYQFNNEQELFSQIKQRAIRFSLYRGISNKYIDIISKMLIKRPQNRIKIDQSLDQIYSSQICFRKKSLYREDSSNVDEQMIDGQLQLDHQSYFNSSFTVKKEINFNISFLAQSVPI